MAKVFIAFYKGYTNEKSFAAFAENALDWAIRKITKGKYSHCELLIEQGGQYTAFGSSPRDGGVRCKAFKPSEKWDLIEINSALEPRILAYFEQTKGARYDVAGVLGFVFFNRQSNSKYFCSEWCFNAITGSNDGWRFSPNELEVIARESKR